MIYQVPAAYRAAAFGIENPSNVVLAHGALALYGLKYRVEGKDTVLMDPSAERNSHGNIYKPSIVRRGCKPEHVWQVRHYGHAFQVASPAAATAQVLREIRRTSQSNGATFAGHSMDLVEAVTLIDCVRRHLGIDPVDILQASSGTVCQRWLTRALAKSSKLADSPKETEMRLLAQMVCDKFGLRLEEQVVVRDGGKIVTTFDLAIPELGIGIMYDGAHHGEAKQWHKDTEINTDLTICGWRVLRFTSASLHKFVEKLVALIHKLQS
ncbi:endonuclease domain-containing protein [Corynebacterium sp. CQ3829_602738]